MNENNWTEDGVLFSAFSDYLLNAFEAPLPLKEDGTIEIKVRNQLKREALPLLAKDLENLLQDATITTDGASIFINFEIPPRGDNGALRFTWELKSTIKKVARNAD